MEDEPDLEGAYALDTADDARRLYARWAETYDRDFCDAQGYQTPREIMRVFTQRAGGGPILDVGAGTGVVGEGLKAAGIGPIDALDLSSEMLEIARDKGVYRDLLVADVTEPLSFGPYAGIVSAGTFTLGHVGPMGLASLMKVASRGCLFVISINEKHFEVAGFGAFFAEIEPEIEGYQNEVFRFYDDRADAGHRYDTGLLVSFRKA